MIKACIFDFVDVPSILVVTLTQSRLYYLRRRGYLLKLATIDSLLMDHERIAADDSFAKVPAAWTWYGYANYQCR